MPPIGVGWRAPTRASVPPQSQLFYPAAQAFFQVVFDGFSDDARDSEPFTFWSPPKELRIVRNSYEQADSWSVTFSALDFPIDPQLVRAGAVELYLYGVTERLNEPQQLQQDGSVLRKLGESAARALALVTGRPSVDLRPTISGLFDNDALDLSPDGKWCTITGQDYTDFLIKKQWKPTANGTARRIPTGKRLDLLLEDILSEADEEGRLRLVVENIDAETLPVVGRNETRANKRGIAVKTDTSYWDVIYKLATRHGTLVFVRGLDVVLTRDKNLTDAYDPRIKRMAWGRNIEHVRLSRNLAKVKAPIVVLRSYDPKSRTTIEVDWPPGSFSQVKKAGAKVKSHKSVAKKSGKVSLREHEEYIIIPVYGITDRAVLLDAAELRYNRIAREEREMTLVTRDLKDLDGDDLLSLAAGDAMQLDFEEFNKESVIQDPSVSDEVKIATLRGRGFSPAVAHIIVQHAGKLQFLARPLRVKEASIDYDTDQGVRIETQLQDFIVVDGRRDVETRPGRRDGRDARLGGRGYSRQRSIANRRQFP